MKPKGGSPPEPVFGHGPRSTNFGQEPKGPIFQPRTNCGPFLSHGLWLAPEATSSAQSHSSPQLKGNISHSFIHAILKDAGVVHICYYIPLCTIFSQQSNGDIFRTQFHDYKSSSQSPSPILKEDLSAYHSGNPWRLSEGPSRTPTTWPCRSWVGNSFRIIKRAILRGYSSFNQL
ncbi:hypothetical protein O181_016802 [Austropuccinia psidii MF-1]|uniref:Uncharacterized protein n=1 Tax=Austropuccinia psidii MF-1 TaxID=1389203 RepID=A0A9Q3GS14_9BASI|nr:hypothetical protein [Austropuccinia psidii MF-1]